MKTGFGWIEIGGIRYDHDVIIHTDGTVSKRKKKMSKSMKGEYGHTPLSEAELGFLAVEKPEVVFIGTGQYGDLPITSGAEAMLVCYLTITKPTPDLLPFVESERRNHAAILHVTC